MKGKRSEFWPKCYTAVKIDNGKDEAGKWYRKAAELGDNDAMNSLAEILNRGDSINNDKAAVHDTSEKQQKVS